MFSWLKRFFTDETAFRGYVRAACIGLGASVEAGYIDPGHELLPPGVGIALMALAGFIRAGEKNPR